MGLGACRKSSAPLDAGALALTVDAGQILLDSPIPESPIPPEELAQVQGRLIYISEAATVPQVHRLSPADGGVEVLTEGPNAHYPAGAVPGSSDILVIETQQMQDQHRERIKRLSAGKKEHVLHPWAGRARAPVWSPDGKWVLVESGLDSFSDLYRLSADGKAKPRRMTHHPHGNFEPSYSADGKEILFVSSRAGNPDLYRMPAEGGEPVVFIQTLGEEVGPRCSPDGSWIAYLSSREGQDRAYVATPDKKTDRLLHKAPLSPLGPMPEPQEKDLAWSPDSREVVLAARKPGEKFRILKVEVASQTSQVLTRGTANDDSPVWSADGKYIAFVSDRDGQPDLYLMRADGTGQTRLTRSDAPEWQPFWVR